DGAQLVLGSGLGMILVHCARFRIGHAALEIGQRRRNCAVLLMPELDRIPDVAQVFDSLAVSFHLTLFGRRSGDSQSDAERSGHGKRGGGSKHSAPGSYAL